MILLAKVYYFKLIFDVLTFKFLSSWLLLLLKSIDNYYYYNYLLELELELESILLLANFIILLSRAYVLIVSSLATISM